MTVLEASKIIGIDLKKEINSHSSFEEAVKKLPELKKRIKKIYRQLSKKLHPDVNDIDDSKMKELNLAYSLLKNLRIIKEKPQPQIIIRFYGMPLYQSTNVRTTPTTGTTTGGWF